VILVIVTIIDFPRSTPSRRKRDIIMRNTESVASKPSRIGALRRFERKIPAITSVLLLALYAWEYWI